MSKNKFYNIFFGIILLLYFIALILYTLNIWYFAYLNLYWFETFLLAMSLLLIMRAVLFRSDSSLLLGSSIFAILIVLIFKAIYNFGLQFIFTPILFGIAISCLLTYLMYKNKFFIKAMIILTFMSLCSVALFFV